MLTELRVTNFKGFGGLHEVPLAPLTLLFGSNSSGKTALLHAIALLAENLQASPFRRSTSSFDMSVPDLDLGGYRNLIHRHDHSSTASIGLGLTADLVGYRHRRDDSIDALGARGAGHDFQLVQDSDGRVTTHSSSVELLRSVNIPLDFVQSAEPRRMELKSLSPDRAHEAAQGLSDLIAHLTGATPEVQRDDDDVDDDDLVELSMLKQVTLEQLEQLPTEALARMLSYGTDLRTPLGSMGHLGGWGRRLENHGNVPREIGTLLERIVISANLILRQMLHRTDYLGPMREVPSRLEEIDPDTRDRLTSSGSGIAAMLYRDRRGLSAVNEMLAELEIPYSVDVKSVGQESLPSAGDYRALVLTDLRTETQVSPRDLGYGITQLLPILVALARRSQNLLLVEQPELHLHPRLHAELANLFVAATRQEQPTQVIAETHSENLVLRVQKLVRNRQLSPEEVSIVYVGASQGAGSWIHPIRMDERGELIDEWPGGFFTERTQEWI